MSRLEITDLTARKCPRENERKQKQHFFFSFAEMTLFMVFLLKLFGSYGRNNAVFSDYGVYKGAFTQKLMGFVV